MRYAYAGQSVGILMQMFLLRAAIGTLWIKHLGGSDLLAMSLGALVGMLRLVAIPTAVLVHPANGKRFMLRGWLLYAMLMAVAILLPSFLGDGKTAAAAFVGAAALAMAVNHSAGTFWFPLLHDVVPRDRRGRFFGNLRATWNTTLVIAVVGAGMFLGEQPATWQFQVILGAGVCGVLLRNLLIARVPEARHGLEGQDDFGDWRLHLRNILARRQVVMFIVYYSLLALCMGFLAQPLVLYMKELGFSPRENVITFGFMPVGMAAALLVGGQLVDRLGTKRVFLASNILLCAACFAIVVIAMQPMPLLKVLLGVAFVVSGAVSAVAALACTAQLFHLSPLQGRPLFLSLASILAYAGPASAMLVAGGVLDITPAGWHVTVGAIHLDVFQVMLCLAGVAMLLVTGLLRFVQDVSPRAQV
jgi:MFS family permease